MYMTVLRVTNFRRQSININEYATIRHENTKRCSPDDTKEQNLKMHLPALILSVSASFQWGGTECQVIEPSTLSEDLWKKHLYLLAYTPSGMVRSGPRTKSWRN